VTFAASHTGQWAIDSVSPVIGETLAPGSRLSVSEGAADLAADSIWTLRGVTSNTRYSNRTEVDRLTAVQEGLGRPQATLAALIPIRKSAAWWALAQDERRAIFEEQSRHIGIGLDYLPGVARRLHHSRELGEPFDFLTWFEYAPEHRDQFEEMVRRLRQTREWDYVEREVDIRLSRA
jgi:chlorite dismutase